MQIEEINFPVIVVKGMSACGDFRRGRKQLHTLFKVLSKHLKNLSYVEISTTQSNVM